MSKKYENGYLPKIDYWQTQWLKACNAADVEARQMAFGRMEYFCKRQEEIYGGTHRAIDYIMQPLNLDK